MAKKNMSESSWQIETELLSSWEKLKQGSMKLKLNTDSQGETETTKVTLKSYKYHGENPFIDQVIEHIHTKKYRKAVGSKVQEVLNEETGVLEQQKVLVLGKQQTVDSQEFYKVYQGQIKSFFKLSSNTMKLFEYIMQNIPYSKDRICLYQPDVTDKLKMSRTTAYRAILQLLEGGIIARADSDNCYFINPIVAFKGDRITLVTQYIKEQEKNSRSIDNVVSTQSEPPTEIK